MTCPDPTLEWPECVAPSTTIAPPPTSAPEPPPTTEVLPPESSVAPPTTETPPLYPFDIDVCLDGAKVTLTITSLSDAYNAYTNGATTWPCQYPPESSAVPTPAEGCADPMQQGFCVAMGTPPTLAPAPPAATTTVVGVAPTLPATGSAQDTALGVGALGALFLILGLGVNRLAKL
jgi:hypothetical protein